MPTPPLLQFRVESPEHGQRLDLVIRKRVRHASRSLLNLWFSSAGVTVDGRHARKGQLACEGQHVQVQMAPLPVAVADDRVALRILIETPELVAVDKPAGQASIALNSADRGTVANALLARYPSTATIGYSPRDAGLVHRLDTGTSGVLIAAKSEGAFRALRQAQHEGRLCKTYLALVYETQLPGERGEIDVPLKAAGRRVVASAPGDRGAHACHSEYRVLARGNGLALLELHARRAYRHQLRAHCAERGFPLLGDLLYGGSRHPGLNRHALHAYRVTLVVGVEDAAHAALPTFDVAAPLPEDLRQVCQDHALPWQSFV